MKKFVKIIKDKKTGQELIMVRGDKTMKDLMGEKPSSRWDPGYWHPNYEGIIKQIKKFETLPLDNCITKTVSGHRGKTEFVKRGGVQSIEAVSILASGTGVDPYLSRQVKIGGVFDSESRRTKAGDLLFARSGVGTAGRSALVTDSSDDMVIGGHILRVELNNKMPAEYIQVYLKTSYGWKMLDRSRTGVGALVLDEADVKAILIPILPRGVMNNITSEFKKVTTYHDKAVEAKKKGDEAGYKKNIETAQKMLKALIAKTEAVIRGERKDVI